MRIAASSYSNTAPLVWSFLYGANRGRVELILDNAPARSAELLDARRVDAALVPVIAYQTIDGLRMVPDVCVGAKQKVRSVCLITDGRDLTDVRSVALDASSKTSVVLTKIIFREFLESDPQWRDAEPNIDEMLARSDAALIIGDPALALSGAVARIAGRRRVYDLAELWHSYTDLGFVFAMWMTRQERCEIDFAAARDEGLAHLDEIAANYEAEMPLSHDELRRYLADNISYSVDPSMQAGLDLFYQLAEKQGEIPYNRECSFV